MLPLRRRGKTIKIDTPRRKISLSCHCPLARERTVVGLPGICNGHGISLDLTAAREPPVVRRPGCRRENDAIKPLQNMTAAIRGSRNPLLSANNAPTGMQRRMSILQGLKRLLTMQQINPPLLCEP